MATRKPTRRGATAAPRTRAAGTPARRAAATRPTKPRGPATRRAKPGSAGTRPEPRAAATRPARPRAAATRKPAKTPGRAASRAAAAPATLAPNGLPVSSAIGLTHLQMQFATQDPEAVRRFYVETLGFANAIAPAGQPFFTVFMTPSASAWFMTPSGDQAPESWQPPGEPVLYAFVEDVDRAHAALAAKGVVFDQPPRDMPWGHRVAILRDPEGRRICLATNRQPGKG